LIRFPQNHRAMAERTFRRFRFRALSIFRSQGFHLARHSLAATEEGLKLADEQDEGGSDDDGGCSYRYDQPPKLVHRWCERVIHLGVVPLITKSF
jgi:hypothetical protein